MKENQHEQHVGDILCCFRQTMRIMRLSLFFIVVGTSMAFSASSYSQSTKLSVNLKDATVQEVIKTIEDQSDFLFLYQEGQVDLNRHISIRAEGKQLQEILDEVFKGTGNIYIVSDRQIVIGKAPRKALEAQLAAIQKDLKTTIEQPQQREITGKVSDQSGQPLPGATIVVKGTSQGTVTDADGNYSLSNVPPDATLVFSFVGMETQEINVGNRTRIDVTMQEGAVALEEVVAIGYGSIKKSDLTGSVSSVRGELISDRQTLQLSQGLQGAVPGLMVTKTGNKPGDDATIRIRGITTINNSDPLYIIDGVPGSINDINPNDIANISVLKDAASASIYGSRAASGVILIETKRARTGTATLNYEMKYSMDVPTRLPDYVGAVQSMKLYNEARWNDAGNTGSEYPLFEQELINNYQTLYAEDPYAYPDYDWLGNTMDDYALTQNHQLTYTMGTEKLKTKASFSYAKSDKLYNDIAEEGAYYERFNARVNNDLTINNFISGTVDIYFSRIRDKEGVIGNAGGAISHTITPLSLGFTPLYTPFWEDGRATGTRAEYNNPAILKNGGSNTL